MPHSNPASSISRWSLPLSCSSISCLPDCNKWMFPKDKVSNHADEYTTVYHQKNGVNVMCFYRMKFRWLSYHFSVEECRRCTWWASIQPCSIRRLHIHNRALTQLLHLWPVELSQIQSIDADLFYKGWSRHFWWTDGPLWESHALLGLVAELPTLLANLSVTPKTLLRKGRRQLPTLLGNLPVTPKTLLRKGQRQFFHRYEDRRRQ